MPINPNIALAVKAPDFQIPNMLAQAAQIAQLQEAQAVAEERNKLRALNPIAADYEAQLFRVNPQLGISYRKERTASEASEASRQKSLAEAASARQGMLGQAMRDISQRPSDANITAHLEDVLTSPLFSKEEKASVQARSEMLLGMPFAERIVFLASQGAKASELKPGTQQINRLGQTDVVQIPAFGGAPTTIGTYADVPLPTAVEEQKSRIANAGAARQITQVNTQLPASEEAQKEFMKSSRLSYDTLKTAPALLTNIEEAKKLIPSAKGFMGPGGEPLLKAASFLNSRLGASIDTKGVTDASELRSRLFSGVIENLRKLDAQPTAGQQQALQDAIGNLGTDPTALPRILDSISDSLRQKVGAYNEEVTNAEARGVKFPYKPQIKLPEPQTPNAARIPGAGPDIDALLKKYR